jgi:hypothetical protein
MAQKSLFANKDDDGDDSHCREVKRYAHTEPCFPEYNLIFSWDR